MSLGTRFVCVCFVSYSTNRFPYYFSFSLAPPETPAHRPPRRCSSASRGESDFLDSVRRTQRGAASQGARFRACHTAALTEIDGIPHTFSGKTRRSHLDPVSQKLQIALF